MTHAAYARPPAATPSDSRLIASTRLLVAAAGLVIVTVAPLQMATPRWMIEATLALQTASALILYLVRSSRRPIVATIAAWEHWIDVAWYTLIVGLTEGTQSTFVIGYFFPIIVASFRWGYAAGLRVTLASAALFVTVGLIAAPPPPEFELQRLLIRPVFLVAFGLVVASRAGFELRLRERLRSLKDMGTISNPRFGVDRTIGLLMHRLRDLHGARVCAMIIRDPVSGEDELRRVVEGDAQGSVHPEKLPPGLTELLLRLPADSALAYSAPGRARLWPLNERVSPSGQTPPRGVGGAATYEAMAGLWDAQAFIAVSMIFPRDNSVTMVLAFAQPRRFEEDDVAFIAQAVEHALPMIDNIRLVDYLASSAASEERKRIARNLHDSVIQPYVGLRMALAGLHHKVTADYPAVGEEVARLLDMSTAGIEDLRRHVSDLRTDAAPGEGLVPAITRYADRYSEFTGIEVAIVAGDTSGISDRVASEAFQLVTEGLSNVRRHSGADRATIHVGCPNGYLALRIEDQGGGAGSFVPFTPRSITERTTALGGRVAVSEGAGGGAIVDIEIPL